MDKREQLVRRLLKVAGTTYADEAGIRIDDKPLPLFQLLVLCMLASKPIDATTAMRSRPDIGAAARMLKQFKGIGGTWVRQYFGDRATAAAKALDCPPTRQSRALSPRGPTRGWPQRWSGRGATATSASR